jgi:hypothetical protein
LQLKCRTLGGYSAVGPFRLTATDGVYQNRRARRLTAHDGRYGCARQLARPRKVLARAAAHQT